MLGLPKQKLRVELWNTGTFLRAFTLDATGLQFLGKKKMKDDHRIIYSPQYYEKNYQPQSSHGNFLHQRDIVKQWNKQCVAQFDQS